jgi:hypothetical protein
MTAARSKAVFRSVIQGGECCGNVFFVVEGERRLSGVQDNKDNDIASFVVEVMRMVRRR